MTKSKPVITREIAALPTRTEDAHKGDAGRVAVIGGCSGETIMAGAPALTANAAFRSGAGLVQMILPSGIQAASSAISPCATVRTMNPGGDGITKMVQEFCADTVAIGPGLGDSVDKHNLVELLTEYAGPIVVDADGLNLLASTSAFDIPYPRRVVLTPHPGEAKRLMIGRSIDPPKGNSPNERAEAIVALQAAYGCTVVYKGRGTLVSDGARIYANETGNCGMATGGAGDVLTGVIAALLGQGMDPLEAAILGTYLHGLAGDFAAEELGRLSMTATDIIDSLPEAFGEQEPLES